MKRPIAMRCTQKQFDSIKDRIPLKIEYVSSFKHYPYLAITDEKVVHNTKKIFQFLKYEIHENFDADIFLEACGVEKVWKGSELQYKYVDSDWLDVRFDVVYRLKPQPDYSQEIEALQKENAEMKALLAELAKDIEVILNQE